MVNIVGMKLMIVDDHAHTREMMRKFLEFPGMTICECVSGDEAVAKAKEFKPNWVTMDIHMPGRNGFQSTEALRKECPSARVMIITSDNQPHFRQLSREVGAAGLLAKENLIAFRMMLEQEVTNRSSAGKKGKQAE